jgi:nucleoside-diphosphate-sugar epimerase
MRAAILGCGYVGTAVARWWQSQGIEVTATTTSPQRVAELSQVAAAVQVIDGSDTAGIAALLHHQDTLLICVGAGRQANYEAVYLDTAKTVVSALDQAPDLKQIIFTSTYSVYGNYNGAWVREDDAAKPVTANGHTMLETEATLLRAATGDRAVCIFRLGGIYGPGRELAHIYRRAAGSTRPGRGHEASNWIHLEDIVGAIAFAQAHRLSGLYNLVQDEVPTVAELIDRVCTVHHLDPVQWDPSQPSARPYNVRVSNQKLKAAGYEFRQPHFPGL